MTNKNNRENKSKHRIIMKGTIKFIDLFAGIGGTRCGLGFPCQSFPAAEKIGMETRGTLFLMLKEF